MNWKETIKLFEDCEQGLQKLITEAVREGDYPGVQRATEFAKAVSTMASEVRAAAAPPTTPATGYAAGAERKGRPAASNYPKFFRRGEELVKIGWSKKERAEYNHRAPRQAVDATIAALQKVGAKLKVFNGGALFPLGNAATGQDVPDYQGYLALAWLTHLGIVKQHGRRSGYSLAKDGQIADSIDAAWAALPEWRG